MCCIRGICILAPGANVRANVSANVSANPIFHPVPPSILRQLPTSINKRISTQANKQTSEDAAPAYQNALGHSNFSHKLEYTAHETRSPHRNRRRNVIWFNPPFNKNVKTNI